MWCWRRVCASRSSFFEVCCPGAPRANKKRLKGQGVMDGVIALSPAAEAFVPSAAAERAGAPVGDLAEQKLMEVEHTVFDAVMESLAGEGWGSASPAAFPHPVFVAAACRGSPARPLLASAAAGAGSRELVPTASSSSNAPRAVVGGNERPSRFCSCGYAAPLLRSGRCEGCGWRWGKIKKNGAFG